MNSAPLALALLAAACVTPSMASASLNDSYPADENGIIHVPQIDQLATWIAGRPYTISCTPDPEDGTLGRTWFTGTENPDGSTNWDGVDSSELNGNECGALDQLLNPEQGFYQRPFVTRVAPLKKHGKKVGSAISVVWPNQHVFQAAEALWDLQHEVTHGIVGGAGFTTPPGQDDSAPAFDEGLVECTAMRNIWNTITHVTSVAWLRHDLLENAKGDHQDTPDEYQAVC